MNISLPSGRARGDHRRRRLPRSPPRPAPARRRRARCGRSTSRRSTTRVLEREVEELHGDVRVESDVRRLVADVDVLVHAAAALPIQESRRAIRSVNVEGTAVTLAAALEAGVRRVVLISSTAVYGVPERHPIHEGDPLVGVGAYGESKIDAERLCAAFGRRGLETVVIRPKTFVGPERLGVFEILFDWIREGRRIPILGSRREPLPAARRRGPRRRSREVVRGAGGRAGAERRRRRVRHRAGRPPGADRPRGLGLAAAAGAGAGRRRSRCAVSSSPISPRSRSGTTGRRTGTRSSRSSSHGSRSGGSRGSPTPRRSARRTTGTSPISPRCARPGSPTGCRGISRRSGCSSGSADRTSRPRGRHRGGDPPRLACVVRPEQPVAPEGRRCVERRERRVVRVGALESRGKALLQRPCSTRRSAYVVPKARPTTTPLAGSASEGQPRTTQRASGSSIAPSWPQMRSTTSGWLPSWR